MAGDEKQVRQNERKQTIVEIQKMAAECWPDFYVFRKVLKQMADEN